MSKSPERKPSGLPGLATSTSTPSGSTTTSPTKPKTSLGRVSPPTNGPTKVPAPGEKIRAGSQPRTRTASPAVPGAGVKQSPPTTSRPTTSGAETNGEAGKRSRSKSGTPRSARSGSTINSGAGQANGTGTGNAGAQGPPEIRRESPEGEKNKSGDSKISPSRGAGGSVGGSRGGSEKRELGTVGSEVGKGVKRDERGEREGSLGEFSLLFLGLFCSRSGYGFGLEDGRLLMSGQSGANGTNEERLGEKKPSWHDVSSGKRGRRPETTVVQSDDGWSKEIHTEAGRGRRVERKKQILG
jgi:hypothetical protein